MDDSVKKISRVIHHCVELILELKTKRYALYMEKKGKARNNLYRNSKLHIVHKFSCQHPIKCDEVSLYLSLINVDITMYYMHTCRCFYIVNILLQKPNIVVS